MLNITLLKLILKLMENIQQLNPKAHAYNHLQCPGEVGLNQKDCCNLQPETHEHSPALKTHTSVNDLSITHTHIYIYFTIYMS